MSHTILFCHNCTYRSNRKANLRNHIINTHINSSSRNKDIKCSSCASTFVNRNYFIQHLVQTHKAVIDVENLEFDSSAEFIKWKTKIEGDNFCRYVTKSGLRKTKSGSFTRRYYCHRDGNFRCTVGTRKKSLKRQGSNKINSSCPSQIIYTEFQTGVIRIKFIKSHYGHDTTNVGRLTLTYDERAAIAEKIEACVDFQNILDDIRNNISDSRDPKASLTRQSLRNIVRDFKLKKHNSQSNDAMSIELWFHKVNNSIDDPSLNPVIHYKRQEESTVIMSDIDNEFEFGNIVCDDQNDIVLIISNQFQREMLRQFGNNIICIDSTQGTIGCDFHLTTLLIVDEYGASVPGAFCISNRRDEATWSFFFKKLKEHPDIGALKPIVFMSDDDESFYNAWIEEMGTVQHRLLSTWHVYRNWRKNATNLIKNKANRAEVYKALNILQKEVNSKDFQLLVQTFVLNLEKDEDTASFAKYFQSYYTNRTSMWANCFRKKCNIYPNTGLVSLHRLFKFFYLDGKKNKRLDRSINALFRYIRDCFFLRVCKKVKNQSPVNLFNIKRSHNTVVKDVQVTEVSNIWSVLSHSNKDSRHEVEQIMKNIEICSPKCVAICKDCQPRICIHTFSCECIDYLINSNICKHIHACVKFLSQNCSIVAANINSAIFETNDDVEDNMLSPLNVIFDELNNRPREVEKLIDKFEIILEHLKNSERDLFHQLSEEQVLIINQNVDQILNIVSQKPCDEDYDSSKLDIS